MVDPGTVALHDSVRPALTAGDYRFDIATDSAAGSFPSQRWLSVEAPRFRIEEHELVATYPMAGTSGDFNEQLPWVALRRRTLPWERRGSAPDRASPWLALVVTLPGEATLGAAELPVVVGDSAAARFGAVPPEPVPALLFPDPATLRAVLPTEPDARLLCHVREVNQADTELAGSDDDGWVAVVVANRVLTAPGDTRWRATLVSLEYRDDLATNQPDTAAVLALASWEFTSTGTGSFQTLMTSLDRAAFGAAPGGSVSYTDHGGATRDAVYRSPLESGGSTEDDITERAAHELGRLIAAADGRLVRELVGWRRSTAIASARAVTARFMATAAAPTDVRAGASPPHPDAFGPPVVLGTGPAHLTAACHALHHLAGAALPAAHPARQAGADATPEARS